MRKLALIAIITLSICNYSHGQSGRLYLETLLGMKVYLNNDLKLIIEESGGLFIDNLSTGTYLLTLRSERYKEYTDSIKIYDGLTTEIVVGAEQLELDLKLRTDVFYYSYQSIGFQRGVFKKYPMYLMIWFQPDGTLIWGGHVEKDKFDKNKQGTMDEYTKSSFKKLDKGTYTYKKEQNRISFRCYFQAEGQNVLNMSTTKMTHIPGKRTLNFEGYSGWINEMGQIVIKCKSPLPNILFDESTVFVPKKFIE